MTSIQSLSSHFHSVLLFSPTLWSRFTQTHKHMSIRIFFFDDGHDYSTLCVCVCVCVCVSCAQSPVESDNRTVILVKPPARPRPAPHIFHLTMYARFASFFPLVFSFCSGEMRSEGAFIYTGVSRLYFSFHSFLSFILFLSKAFKIRDPLPVCLIFCLCQTLKMKKSYLSVGSFSVFLSFLILCLSFLISVFSIWRICKVENLLCVPC